MSPTLPASARTRLAKLLGMLGSDHASERDPSAVAAHRIVVQAVRGDRFAPRRPMGMPQ